MNIAHLIERGQSLFPDKTALIYEERSYTYTELNELSNRIANLLADLGIAHGDRVALYLPNLPEFVTAFFGIQKVGAIAVVINAALKADEIKYILQDSDTKLTITTETLQGNIEANQLQVLIADQHKDVEQADNLLTELMNNASARFKTVDMSDNDPAILLYTSGTTGYPKGVMLSHNNLLSNIQMFSYTVHLTPDDRLLLFLPIAHSYGLTSTMLPCFDVCGTLILHRDFEIDTLGQTIANHGVTVFYGVPTIYSLLLDKVSANQMKSVHRYISGGATLASELNQKWQAKFGVIINEEYGMTETSLICFNDFLKRKAGTVGRPLDGVEVQIVDEDDKPVSTGELGEITVRSPGVMLGYWNQPQETAEAIKAGWFHTGDIGRVDEYGYVSIVDRLKEMINVGAQKVYPTEVEHVLYQHPAVEQVAVYGVPESLLGEQVRTSIILKAEVTAEELTIFCRQRLADYKVPAGIEFVDSLPKGKTGKILKRVLREEAEKRLPQATSQALSRSADEIRSWLYEWLTSHLGEGDITLDRPFSDYGLTSVLAVNMITALNEWLGSSLAPIVAWNYPTIEKLVAYITQEADTTQTESPRMELWPAIDPYHVYDPLMYTRLTSHTERMDKYRLAIQKTVRDKIVLEIGPGQEANLTRMCVEAGAKHVYAVEISEPAYQQALTLIKKLNLSDNVTLIQGDVTKVKLPELAEVNLSSLAGQIGGNEGVVTIINQTKQLLKPKATIVPQRYVSKIAAVTLPDHIALHPEFTPLGQSYAQKIFEQIGHPLDLQVVINNFDISCIISDASVFEELDFSQPTVSQDYEHFIHLTITQSQTRLDGFIIWLNLHLVEGVQLDILESPGSWLPIYFPVFHPGVSVSAGDVIEATCYGALSDNGINPDYRIKGRLIRQHGEDIEFDYRAYHHANYFKQSSFYQQLFKDSLVESKGLSEPEPIAIIGIGCRFPGGADTPGKFWHNLEKGIDTVTDIPAERWDVEGYYDSHKDTLGKMYVKHGSFLKEVTKFDASFFGIPPLEASSLDPQQRLLLEVAWEALENAGISAHDIQYSQTGIFTGSFWDDYSGLHLYHDTPEAIDAYRMLSGLRGMVAGRLAYILKLHGPTMQLDTACSSSLLAIHLACQALRNRECNLAITGGVTLFLSPTPMIGLCRTYALSPDGRSKSFAASADGFGVGEGAGLVILKRLSEAVADGDTVLAVIKGSAVNHDGPSNGLTAPNGLAQEAMLRQALQNAQVSPDQIDYIEAHGTGTELGDPIEVGALSQVFATNRDRPLLIGSVKSNIGHLSAAAGVASLIKVVLSLQHGLIPPSLHFDEPNPHIPWSEIPFTVPTEPTPWPANNGSRLAGISSFGLTGTNVHVVVAEAPAPVEVVSEQTRPQHLLTLSGKTEQALADQVAQYQRYLKQHGDLNLGDVCYTSNVGRVHFEQRLGVVAAEMAELQQKLAVYQSGELPLGMAQGVGQAEKPKVAFLFPGQGPQYAAMGRELYETQPVFREIMDDCDQILQSYWDKSLLEILYGADEANNDQLLDEATYAQPALFAIEYALAKLWQSWGIEPEVVIGHSMGEYAAACFAGVFSLADGLKLIAERGRLMQEEAEAGQMVAVLASAEEVAPVIEPFAAEVSIGVINTPQNLVISGRPSGVKKAVETLEAAGIETRQLKIYVASHSPLMDKILDPFEAVVESVTKHPPQIKVVSNLTGTVVAEELTTPGYWRQHLRNSVQFAQGMATLAGLGIDTFIEVGPKPTLLGMGQQCLPEAQAVWLPSLYPKQQGDWAQLLSSVGQFHVQGGRVDWAAVHQPYGYQKLSLPTYPFQRKRYWIDRPKTGRRSGEVGHPLLGNKFESPTTSEIHFENELSSDYPAYLSDHQVYEQVVVPATAYLEMALSAGHQIAEGEPFELRQISFQQPLVLPAGGESQKVQLVASPQEAGYQWQIFSQGDSQVWQLHVQGQVVTPDEAIGFEGLSLKTVQDRCSEGVSLAEYDASVPPGLYFGPDFQGLEQLFRGEGEALGLVQLPDNLVATDYQLHPVLLDCCLRVGGIIESEETDSPYLPFSCETVRLHPASSLTRVWSHVQLRGEVSGTRQMDITLYNEAGQVVAELIGFGLRQANRQAITGSTLRTDWLYQLDWPPAKLPSQSPYQDKPGHWLIVSEASDLAQELAEQLRNQGEQVDQSSTIHDPLSTDYRGVIYLAAPSHPMSSSHRMTMVPDAALAISRQLLELVQGLIKAELTPDLWLVTTEKVEQAVLWGMARTLHWEYPQLNSRCVAMQAETTGETLFETIWYADEENQISLTGTERQVARLERLPLLHPEEQPYPFQVRLEQYGLLDRLQLVPASRQSPHANQVEVQVRAVGLNFKDVLHALGMLKDYYPPELGLEDSLNQPFGFEGAGVITNVGSEVTEFAVGDEVIIWAAEQVMASFVTVGTEDISHKPEHLSFAEAATIPITYLTAYYGLMELAQMKAGDRVLIHAAAGGVGQAAIQLAKHVGAELFATASPRKWGFLKEQGIQHIMNSRTLDYAEEIKSLTNGEGVDVVLNSLNGEYIPKNFDVLAENGRFIEIGKIDIWDESQAQTYRPDVYYAAFDLGEAAAATPGLMARLQSKVGRLFVEQKVTPHTYQDFPITEVSEAFQFMAQAKHIGKVVLMVPEHPPGEAETIRSEGSYLITGGLGGLGLKVAAWLIGQGATHLVLSSRRGATSETAQTMIAELEAQGATVQIVKADVSQEEEVKRLLAESQKEVPLAGIIHAAGVLDDGVVTQQTEARFAKVFAPKVQGSWYLHQHSQDIPLDFFVCFSSMASLLGNGGQTNYAAANAFMDSLMQERRAMGLPGLSINWGGWSEVGLAKELMKKETEAISPEQGVALFEALVNHSTSSGQSQVGVIPVNWSRFSKQLPSTEGFPVLSKLIKPKRVASQTTLRHQLSQASAEEGYELLKRHLRSEVEFIVGMMPTDEQGLFDLGMDSLMSIQLANRLSATIGFSIPIAMILEHTTVSKLSQVLLKMVNLALRVSEQNQQYLTDDDYEEGEL